MDCIGLELIQNGLVSQILINMQINYLRGGLKMQKNSDQLQIFPIKPSKENELTCLQEDFLVKLSALAEQDEDLKTPEVHSFLKLQGFSKITLKMKNPYPVYFSKTLKVYLATTLDEHLLSSTGFCPTLITPLNANWLILNGGSPKIGKESTSLEDIME